MNRYLNRVVVIQFHSAIVLVFCLVMLLGFSSISFAKSTSKTAPKMASLLPESSLVIGAIVTSMRGKPLSRDISKQIGFTDGLAKSLREKHFRYGGFTLTSTAISEYHYLESDPDFRWLSVLLRFYDDNNRSVTTAVRAEYRLKGKKIIVESVIILPLSSNNPRVKLYYVPIDKLSDKLFKKTTSYKNLLKLVQKKAIPINLPKQVPHERQDYWVFAFVMDRLTQDAQIELRVSKSQKGMKGDNVKAKSLNFDNWFVSRARGTLALGLANKVFYKVVYSSSNNIPVEKRTPQLIGVFST